MNQYIALMQHVVDYIEENIGEEVTLAHLSRRFNVSEYHFERLFSGIVGKSLKQYILGRKLTLGLERLGTSCDKVLDVAFELGFEYPEVFSRAFKKQFGISPSTYRTNRPAVKGMDKASIVSRDIMNFMGGVTLKASYIPLEPQELAGFAVDVDTADPNYGDILKRESESFLSQSIDLSCLDHEFFYSVVNCHGDSSGCYTVFSGKRIIGDAPPKSFKRRDVPSGWYAGFVYLGDMIEMRSTFMDDLFRWIVQKDVQLNSNGVGMIACYAKDYAETQKVQILVPIVEPK